MEFILTSYTNNLSALKICKKIKNERNLKEVISPAKIF